MRTIQCLAAGGVLAAACAEVNPDFDVPGVDVGGGEVSTGEGTSAAEAGTGTTGDGDSSTGDGDGTSGDGDGDGTNGDGDGTTGDGDGTTGDGDGDGTTGDGTTGDGDGTTDCGATIAGIIACYDFETPTDGVADDSGPFALDGITSVLGATIGYDGVAARFASISTVSVPHDVNFNPTQMTISAWVRVNALPVTGASLLVRREGQMQLGVAANAKLSCGVFGTGALTGGSVTIGTWTHLACVFDGQVRMYQDGVQRGMVGTPGSALPSVTTPLEMGGPALGDGFDGDLDIVRVYGVALSEADVCTLAGC